MQQSSLHEDKVDDVAFPPELCDNMPIRRGESPVGVSREEAATSVHETPLITSDKDGDSLLSRDQDELHTEVRETSVSSTEKEDAICVPSPPSDIVTMDENANQDNNNCLKSDDVSRQDTVSPLNLSKMADVIFDTSPVSPCDHKSKTEDEAVEKKDDVSKVIAASPAIRATNFSILEILKPEFGSQKSVGMNRRDRAFKSTSAPYISPAKITRDPPDCFTQNDALRFWEKQFSDLRQIGLISNLTLRSSGRPNEEIFPHSPLSPPRSAFQCLKFRKDKTDCPLAASHFHENMFPRLHESSRDHVRLHRFSAKEGPGTTSTHPYVPDDKQRSSIFPPYAQNEFTLSPSLATAPSKDHARHAMSPSSRRDQRTLETKNKSSVRNGPGPRRSRADGRQDERSEMKSKKPHSDNMAWPAWVYCTRYSDRPSSGPRSRKIKKRSRSEEEKRPRTAFTVEQLAILKREFDENRYLTEERRMRLARDLDLNESQIKIWFQNKRAKIKKSSGVRNGLALQLMAQGLYNHSTVPCKDENDMES